eukprot:gnl/TRDRNA2_/TRDRNA2_183322_c0_seq1.p1 gnl/TRDRNA2_/TRDRNA2_183322_c0~~gnl/TRDRNA2_/TRDRNA2_183322_c0_seq1.p1  ORF type:complete len:817 (+),score=144.13 gnl/TRDRNA2_/TRDRNA2_183322_c0_seq1:57-2507(+)
MMEVDARPLTDAARFLVEALGRCERGTALRFGGVLRKWAAEGRPYRGRAFTLDEVEAALAAFAKEQGGKSQNQDAAKAAEATKACHSVDAADAPGEERRLVWVRAAGAWALGPGVADGQPRAPWPPSTLLDAAAQIARSLGPVPDSKASAGSALLSGLFNLTRKSAADGAKCDATVVAAGGISVSAHRALLATASAYFESRFSGRYGDEGGQVDASAFAAPVVRAAVEFAYLGACRVTVADLDALAALADMWQYDLLIEAVCKRVAELPAVFCLQVLAEWDELAASPDCLRATLARNVAGRLEAAAGALAPLPSPPILDPRKPDAAPIVEPLPPCVAAGWRFVHQLHRGVAEMSPEALAKVRIILTNETQDGRDIVGALENFLVMALRAVRYASPSDLEALSSAQFKAFLPDTVLCTVVARLCKEVGLADETGNLHAWVQWAPASMKRFEVLWSMYDLLRKTKPKEPDPGVTAADALLRPDEGEAAAAAPEDEPRHGRPLPELMESSFAMAFADALQHDRKAPSQWGQLLVVPSGTWTAVDESLVHAARMVRRSRSLPKRAPTSVVLRILCEATRSLPPAAVRISGPASIAGVYERSAEAGLFVLRGSCELTPEDGKPGGSSAPLVLRRTVRAQNKNVCMAWTGVAMSLLQAARAEWKVQLPSDDPEVDTPLALALDEAEDPSKLLAPWWIRGKGGKFKPEPTIQISKESASQAEVAPVVDAVATWVADGGSLPALARGAAGFGNDSLGQRLPVVLQICRIAGTSANKRRREEEAVGSERGPDVDPDNELESKSSAKKRLSEGMCAPGGEGHPGGA